MSDLPKLPSIRFGFIAPPAARFENVTGQDVFYSAADGVAGRWIKSSFWFAAPGFYDDAKKGFFAITHLQKKSRFGFLVLKPFILHVWFTWRFQKQETKPDGAVVWVEGTERVTYGRTPGRRFDFAQNKFIRSRGYFSFTHWD